MIIVIMGVTGSGKSTVGKLLAGKLNIPFLDADTYHNKSNIAQNEKGISVE